MKIPFVSIIIPVYNVEPYIEECIRSVMSQTYTGSMECIIVDDCGADDSIQICEKLIREYQGPIKFTILHHPHNRGLSAARNTGINHAKGEYLYFLDSDDMITPDCIESLVLLTVKYPGVQIVQGWAHYDTGELYYLKWSSKYKEFLKNGKLIDFYLFNYLPETIWNKLIHKDFLLANKLYFVEGFNHEDEYWRLMAHDKIKSIAIAPNVTYTYRIRPGSIVANSNSTKKARIMSEITKDILLKDHFKGSRASTLFLCRYAFNLFNHWNLDTEGKENINNIYKGLNKGKKLNWKLKTLIFLAINCKLSEREWLRCLNFFYPSDWVCIRRNHL